MAAKLGSARTHRADDPHLAAWPPGAAQPRARGRLKMKMIHTQQWGDQGRREAGGLALWTLGTSWSRMQMALLFIEMHGTCFPLSFLFSLLSSINE